MRTLPRFPPCPSRFLNFDRGSRSDTNRKNFSRDSPFENGRIILKEVPSSISASTRCLRRGTTERLPIRNTHSMVDDLSAFIQDRIFWSSLETIKRATGLVLFLFLVCGEKGAVLMYMSVLVVLVYVFLPLLLPLPKKIGLVREGWRQGLPAIRRLTLLDCGRVCPIWRC